MGSAAGVLYRVIAVSVAVVATVAALGLYAGISSGSASPVLVGAGDIATCRGNGDEATAKLLENIHGTVFTAGDNAYPDGTARDFADCYGPSWGRFRERTRPAIGNHEYGTPGASGYFGYFGTAAGPSSRGYYSYDKGEWHVVVLNSVCEEVGGCGSDSPMVDWLEKNLAANSGKRCTLAYFHYPLFSSGEHGNQVQMKPTWKALFAADADLIVSGHDHDYERFAPQKPDGTKDAYRGIREFVVGTGGGEQRPFGRVEPNSQVRKANAPGVLKLTLKPGGYAWKFVPVAGQTFTDSGSRSCH